MKILSIDVGIKNLAILILEYIPEEESLQNNNLKILQWDILNLSNEKLTCCKCSKNALFSKDNTFYCKIHTKNSNYSIPEIKLNVLLKNNLKFLKDFCIEKNISLDSKIDKNTITNYIIEYYKNNYYEHIDTTNSNDINIIDLGINLKNNLDKLFLNHEINSIDKILIENQIGPIANRMKSIQGMITQYLILNNNYNIEYVSPINKLKYFDNSKKLSYNERKKLSIIYTQKILNKKNMFHDLEYFNNHSKKDDLADTLLQALYFLIFQNIIKINNII
jgi:hypothetical protein